MIYLLIAFLFFALYSYLVYPMLLILISTLYINPWKKKNCSFKVSIIISAYNEETVIAQKLYNSLDLDYPPDKLEVIVSSDGSTDETESIVRGFQNQNVVLKSFSRIGKTACLNRVVPKAEGDIILFTDANSMFPNDLLKKMVPNFYDLQIGLVTGSTKYRSDDGSEASIGTYSRLEHWTRAKESVISSCVGADGAVFAMRKSLYQPLLEDDINDFVIPLNVIRCGKRVVSDPNVFCIENSKNTASLNYRRQVRITTRTLWALKRNIEFFNLVKYDLFLILSNIA